jgi:hypothetical protein
MKNRFFTAGAAGLLAAALIFTGCTMTGSSGGGGRVKGSAIRLTENVWAEGSFTSMDKDQWFRFTATAQTQHLHVRLGNQADFYVQLYDANSSVGDKEHIYGNGGSALISRSTTSGKEYYIEVTQDDFGKSAYWIAFSAMSIPPGTLDTATTLTANTWANGSITATNREQWFKFTATEATHYLHVRNNTLDLEVQPYDSNGGTIGNSSLSDNKKSVSTTAGQVYYVRVTPHLSSGSGTYQLAFNTSTTSP